MRTAPGSKVPVRRSGTLPCTLCGMARRRWVRWLPPLLGIVLFAVALFVLHRELHRISWHQLLARLAVMPVWALLAASAATVASYFFLSQYDVLSLRYVGAAVPYRKGTLAGFLSYSFAHSVGMTVFSGAPLRFRLYTAWGLSAVEIATLLAFNSVSFWMGIISAAGISFTVAGGVVPSGVHLPIGPLRPVGVLLLLIPIGYLALCALRRKPLPVGRWQLPLPPLRLAASQVVVACLDWTAASAVLYALLPAGARGHFAHFVSVFILAQIAGLVSQVPGGLGVFEGVIVFLLHGSAAQEQAIASLVVYRLIYYFVPLAVAALLLLAYEVRQRREDVGKAVRLVSGWLPAVAPHLLAGLCFAGGVVLLIFGSLPSAPQRLRWLGDVVPLLLLEVSHFVGSMVGLGLLLLAWGLRRRLEAAWVMASGLLAVGVVVAVLRGLHLGAATFLALMLLAFLPARRFFYRRTPLLSEPMSGTWLVGVGMVVVAAVWIGMLVYRHVDFSTDLWWQFTLHGNAPRFLRASVGVALGLAALGLVRLLGPAAPREAEAGPETDSRVLAVVERSPVAVSRLALLGDKRFFFSDHGNAFVMYGVQGRSWVAMGDPVGPPDEHRELIWRFYALVDRHGGWPVFYEVGDGNLPAYIDLGLTVLKIGEEARVRLESFSLEGSERKPLRHAVRRLERDGCTFEVLSDASATALFPELKVVSDAWLGAKGTREKRFSLGRFDEHYLLQTPVAVIRQGGRVVAFANLWLGAEGGELSIDLMRHLPDAPGGVMDALFVHLMLWGKERGYSAFALGMAPLAGLRTGPFASLWNRLAGLLYRYGEHFYNFQGLRQYKEKFDPDWQPRFLVCPGGGALPGVLTDLAALVSGGLIGALRR